MSGTKHFDDLVYWHRNGPFESAWTKGWRPNGGLFTDTITPDDGYWGRVLHEGPRNVR